MANFRSRQSGVGLVTAIVLLVMMAGLGAAVIALTTGQAVTSALDLQGARAYQAARAGAEYAAYRARIDNVCAADSFVLPTPMEAFRVSVTCTEAPQFVTETRTIRRFHVTATACTLSNGACPNAQANADYVQRVVEMRFGAIN
jgi:MSHA biogenesis protein MshP